MRKAILAGALVALVAVTAPVSAQSSGSWELGLGGGVTLPTGNAADFYKTGYHGTALVGYRPAASKVWIGLDAQYHHFTQKSFGVNVNGEGANSFAAFGRLNYDAAPTVYLLGGLGLFRTENKANIGGVPVKETDSNMAVEAGAGLRLGKSLFLEGKLVNVFVSNNNQLFIPITLGVRF
ncbi:MAG: outer membrane beta-barrel protein [Gemmatimonadota bacterium]